jgi:hypothetical protein
MPATTPLAVPAMATASRPSGAGVVGGAADVAV